MELCIHCNTRIFQVERASGTGSMWIHADPLDVFPGSDGSHDPTPAP